MTSDVPDYALVAGVPARQVGWVSEHGCNLTLDEQGRGTCPESDTRLSIVKSSIAQTMNSTLFEQLRSKEATMSVVGLGYVGLPIALAFAKSLRVIGFDIHEGRIDMMRKGKDPSEEVPPSGFDERDIHFTSNPDELKRAQFHIVAVPTPIHASHQPDLEPLLAASRTVGNALKPVTSWCMKAPFILVALKKIAPRSRSVQWTHHGQGFLRCVQP